MFSSSSVMFSTRESRCLVNRGGLLGRDFVDLVFFRVQGDLNLVQNRAEVLVELGVEDGSDMLQARNPCPSAASPTRTQAMSRCPICMVPWA